MKSVSKSVSDLSNLEKCQKCDELKLAQHDDGGKDRKKSLRRVSTPSIKSSNLVQRVNNTSFFQTPQQIILRMKKIHQSETIEDLSAQVKQLKSKLNSQKLHMNMIVHDLRSPAEAIQSGLKKCQESVMTEINQLYLEVQEEI